MAARNLARQLQEAVESNPPDPEFRRVGLGYSAAFPDVKVNMELTRVRESRGEVSGELGVTHTWPDGRVGHLYRGRFNVSSLTARTTAAKYLGSRLEGIDWAGCLERFCVGVLESQGKGESFQKVGRMDRTNVPMKLLDPLLTIGEATTIFGPGGTGKSTLAALISVSVQTGTEVFPGWKPLSGNGPVLVLDWESGPEAWDDLVSQISTGVGLKPPEIHYRQCRGRLADQVEEVASYVEQNNIILVIVDSVGMALGTSREGASPEEGAMAMYEALRMIGCTALLIDHIAGQDLGKEAAVSKPYGSVYKQNLARSVFELKREKEPTEDRAELILIHNKVNRGAKHSALGMAIEYQPGSIKFERIAIEDPGLSGALPIRERLYRLLLRGPMPPARIAEELNIKPDNIRVYLSRDKRLMRLQDGRIAVVNP